MARGFDIDKTGFIQSDKLFKVLSLMGLSLDEKVTFQFKYNDFIEILRIQTRKLD
jgi:Ca2+-binding EF-hand superfamily protein